MEAEELGHLPLAVQVVRVDAPRRQPRHLSVHDAVLLALVEVAHLQHGCKWSQARNWQLEAALL
eukprot:6203476-Pleurochrysis_carterae.AAC.1